VGSGQERCIDREGFYLYHSERHRCMYMVHDVSVLVEPDIDALPPVVLLRNVALSV